MDNSDKTCFILTIFIVIVCLYYHLTTKYNLLYTSAIIKQNVQHKLLSHSENDSNFGMRYTYVDIWYPTIQDLSFFCLLTTFPDWKQIKKVFFVKYIMITNTRVAMNVIPEKQFLMQWTNIHLYATSKILQGKLFWTGSNSANQDTLDILVFL